MNREQENTVWFPMSTAPEGCVTEDAGCRGNSDWFIARPSKKYRKHAAPFVVIRRRSWPHGDCWVDNGNTDYVADYFDGWMPIHALEPAPKVTEEEVERAAKGILNRMSSTYKARNGREVGIEADNGEKCWIVHSDDIEALRAALEAAKGEEG